MVLALQSDATHQPMTLHSKMAAQSSIVPRTARHASLGRSRARRWPKAICFFSMRLLPRRWLAPPFTQRRPPCAQPPSSMVSCLNSAARHVPNSVYLRFQRAARASSKVVVSSVPGIASYVGKDGGIAASQASCRRRVRQHGSDALRVRRRQPTRRGLLSSCILLKAWIRLLDRSASSSVVPFIRAVSVSHQSIFHRGAFMGMRVCAYVPVRACARVQVRA